MHKVLVFALFALIGFAVLMDVAEASTDNRPGTIGHSIKAGMWTNYKVCPSANAPGPCYFTMDNGTVYTINNGTVTFR